MTNRIRFTTLNIFLLFLLAETVAAQDPQLSQYYNAPLYLNPALTGTGDNTRAIINYRNQWAGVGPAFTTYAFSFDHDIKTINSGVGLLVLRDRQGAGRLSSTEISPVFSHEIQLSKEYAFRAAVQPSFVSRGADFSNFTFGDQLNSGDPSSQDKLVTNYKRNNYLDFSSGGVFYSDKMWIGLSMHHMNRPNQSFVGGNFRLPAKTSIHGGYKIRLEQYDPRYGREEKERSFIPTFMYKHQGKFDQLDLGAYVLYEPIMLGFWYRGIPIKQFEGLPNNESLVFLAGVNHKGFTFAYSYDVTISKLSARSGGSHEISLIYEWRVPYKKKPMKRLPCPKF